MTARILASGLVSALGHTLADCLQTLYRSDDCLRPQTLAELQPPLTLPYCGVENAPTGAEERLQWLLDRSLAQVLEQHPLSASERQQIPLFVGSSCYGIGIAESHYRQQYQQNPQLAIPLPLDGFTQINSHLRRQHHFCGTDYAFNTACTATANALLAAIAAIDHGACEYALVVGLEVCNSTTLSGFHGMQLLARDGMRPFDRQRNGLILGEGCGILLLGSGRTGDSGPELLGGASRCDSYSISASNPDGSSIALVMREALDRCRVATDDVRAIKAHGTATPLNDDAEAAGMKRLFGPTTVPPFFSLKATLGHTLGSCGVIETLLTAACLQAGKLPASGGFTKADPTLGVSPLRRTQNAPAGDYLLNFFGFGGNNCSLLLRHHR